MNFGNVRRLVNGDAGSVNTAHLAGANAGGAGVFHKNNGV